MCVYVCVEGVGLDGEVRDVLSLHVKDPRLGLSSAWPPPPPINRVFSSWLNRPLVSTRRPIGSSLITDSQLNIREPRARQTVGTLMVSDSRNCRTCQGKK